MRVHIHGKNMQVSQRLEDYGNKKLSKLERYMPNIVEAQLDLRIEKQKGKEQPIAQVTVRNSRGVVLRAEDKKQEDFFAAIDIAIDKLHKQISRYKGKSKRRQKGKGADIWSEIEWDTVEALPPELEYVDDYDSEPKQQVIRRKVVTLTPMSEVEAIDQMELLGHDFFLFYNGEEDTMNVLYRREDGQYGVLTPQID
ncbi:MAG: ribosome hibernation-promoting factor, HPF/YfiA family [Anaerolineales bacterium]